MDELTVIMDEDPHPAAVNMALDELLVRQATRPLLRWYRWAQPALSLGYFVRLENVRWMLNEREAVRRWTGGGVVEHGKDFTYSLIVPRREALAHLTAPESYRYIHSTVAEMLTGAALAETPGPKHSEACFDHAERADVVLQGRKVAGGAQRRTSTCLLHQGSIQIPRLGGDFARQLAAAMASAVTMRGLREEELRAGHELAATKYGTEAWLTRY